MPALSKARRDKRRVDLACGYSVLCYIAATLLWLSVLLMPGLDLLFLVMAGCGGFFGLLRTLVIPTRYKIVPLATLGYVGLTIAFIALSTPPYAGWLIVFSGISYTAACFLPTRKLWKHEFGQPLPKWLCLGCGYPLFGLTQPICPECGKAFNLDDVPAMPDQHAEPRG